VSATDNDRNAGSAKDFVGKVEGAVGSMAGTQAAGVALEAAETLRDGSQAVVKKIEDFRSAFCWSRSALALRWRY
jgi:hypothetical protein